MLPALKAAAPGLTPQQLHKLTEHHHDDWAVGELPFKSKGISLKLGTCWVPHRSSCTSSQSTSHFASSHCRNFSATGLGGMRGTLSLLRALQAVEAAPAPPNPAQGLAGVEVACLFRALCLDCYRAGRGWRHAAAAACAAGCRSGASAWRTFVKPSSLRIAPPTVHLNTQTLHLLQGWAGRAARCRCCARCRRPWKRRRRRGRQTTMTSCCWTPRWAAPLCQQP